MNPSRRTAALVGALFLLTEIGAIVGRLLYAPVLNTPGYVLGDGPDSLVLLGVLFEVMLMVGVVGTGVVLYPVLQHRRPALALGYLAARVLEAAVIAVGTLSLLTVLMLRQHSAGVDDATLEGIATALLTLQDGTLLFGPGFALGIGSILLAVAVFTTRLVPRAIAVLGLVGGTTITLSTVLVIFGVYGQFSPTGLIVALPVFAWELALAVWFIVKGFTTTPAGAESAGAVSAAEALRPARPEPLAPASSRN
jgi:hypothetical protein